MAERAPDALGKLAGALGDPVCDPGATGRLIARLAALSGHTRLSTLGVEPHHLAEVSEAVQQHPGLANTPSAPNANEVLRLLQSAL
jgi:alcohol dehydrogenase class IV